MDSGTRRQIEMALRVRDFVRAHPLDDPGYAVLVSRLESATARADALSAQQRGGLIAVQAAIEHQQVLSDTLLRSLLTHVNRVGRAASKQYPELAKRFTVDAPRVPLLTLGTVARAVLTEAKAHEAQLREYGMLESLLPELEAAITTFEQVAQERTAGRRAHIGARTELKLLRTEIRQVVDLLGSVIRVRFANDAATMAVWNNAKAVIQPARPAAPTTDASADAPSAQ